MQNDTTNKNGVRGWLARLVSKITTDRILLVWAGVFMVYEANCLTLGMGFVPLHAGALALQSCAFTWSVISANKHITETAHD